MNQNILFREIKPEDNGILAEIIRTNLKAHSLDIPGTVYFDDNLNYLSDFYLGDREKRYYCIAEDNLGIIGGIGLAEVPFLNDTAELQKLYLTNRAKGKAIGYDLISFIENKAKTLGYKRMYLETHTNLSAAIHIYEKWGYRLIDRPKEIVHSTMNRFYIKDLF